MMNSVILRASLTVVVLLLAALPARAHYLELERALSHPDRFTVGLAQTGPPFAYLEEGVWRGFEVVMAQSVADAHNLGLRIVALARDELTAALERGEVDAINTMALEDEPAGSRMIPYLVLGDHVMILRGNPFRIRDLDDLQGRTVSATSGSSAERFAHALNDRFKQSGARPMQVHSFPFHRDTHVPVSMGHAAAYFVQTVSAVAVTRDPDARVRLLEGAFRPLREVGFAVRAVNRDLFHAVEHAVAAMVATGKYEHIRRTYKLPQELSPYR